MKEHAEFHLIKAWELGTTTPITSYYLGSFIAIVSILSSLIN